MLTFISADYYFSSGISVSGANMTTGSDAGKPFDGSIFVPIPLGNVQIETNSEVNEFSSHYSGFFNLNNCHHRKLTGTLIAMPSYSAKPLVAYDTIFGRRIPVGPVLTHLVTTESAELYKCCTGRYNNLTDGKWWFGLGVMKYGNVYISVAGGADLGDSLKNYLGYYQQFNITEMVYLGNRQVKSKIWTYTAVTKRRVSSVSPLGAIKAELSNILLLHDQRAWVVDTISGSQFLTGNSGQIQLSTSLSVITELCFPVIDRNPNWEELAARAYQSVSFFNSNGIALVGDIANLKNDLNSTKNLVSMLSSSGGKAAVIAKLFLAFYYGWRLLVFDLKALSDAGHRIAALQSRRQKCSASSTWGANGAQYKAYFHCYYTRFDQLLSPIDQLVSEFGLELNLSNIWDLIPFSFVVDWFVKIGNLLDQIDSFYRISQEHRIVCSGRSIKCTRSVDALSAGLKGWQGCINLTLYEREYSDRITYPQFSFSTPQTFNHYVESTALIVSRR